MKDIGQYIMSTFANLNLNKKCPLHVLNTVEVPEGA